MVEWTWCLCWVPLQCAMVGEVGDDQLWGSGRGATTNFEGVDVVPLLDAIAGCHCSVSWLRCHCWVPLQGAIVVCYGGGYGGGR